MNTNKESLDLIELGHDNLPLKVCRRGMIKNIFSDKLSSLQLETNLFYYTIIIFIFFFLISNQDTEIFNF